MNKKISFLSVILLVFLCASCTTLSKKTGNGDERSKSTPATYSDRHNAVTRIGQDKIYRVTLFANEYPLPMNKIHSWTAHVETPESEIVEDARIRVHGGMPAHQHDFPTTPRVKKYLGNGDYLIEGVKFSMPGEWEMRLNIVEEKKLKRDSVVFVIDL